jgi:hypothetical protein
MVYGKGRSTDQNALTRRVVPDSPSRRVVFWMFKRKLGESAIPWLAESGSR